MSTNDIMAELLAVARDSGALTAAAIPASRIVVDRRVRLKCQVPRCPHYGVNLMCPPNVLSVEEFAAALALYRDAILVQVPIELPPDRPELGTQELHELYVAGTFDEALVVASRRLAEIVRQVEVKALGLGKHFAAGFTAGSCRLCYECVTVQSGQGCRMAFQARPAMEAVGIDVVATCAAAGLSITFGSPSAARWTGLVLVE